ncbi:MAG TPA: NEW3 domain-containing protein [Candidatus Acidoferrum sp.]|nr:NEW3 domain-containing protein [Candidatus Acidoferrum sp.]
MSGSNPSARTGSRRLAAAAGVLSLVAVLLGGPAGVVAATPPKVTTPYPSVAVSPGTKVSFDLTVTSATSETVNLATERIPSGWTATIRGGGFQVAAVTAGTGTEAAHVTLEVDTPAGAAPGTYTMDVKGSDAAGSSTQELQIQLNAEAGGQVRLNSDFPSLSGASGTTFTFTLTLSNDTPEDRTFAVSAAGPDGWQVTARPSDQSQASSVPVKASSSATITVTAAPPATAPAGQYPIAVKATQGGNEIDAQLVVQIIGQYQLTLTTPDQRLNAEGTAGAAIPFQIVVQNSGTAPLQAVKLTSTPPTDWKITFSPSDTIASIDPNTSKTIIANITPSDQAIAGDYVVAFTATASQANATQDVRVTVDTSLTWAAVGIGLIVLVFVALFLVFRRFGRR